jgi:hypothetical protein
LFPEQFTPPAIRAEKRVNLRTSSAALTLFLLDRREKFVSLEEAAVVTTRYKRVERSEPAKILLSPRMAAQNETRPEEHGAAPKLSRPSQRPGFSLNRVTITKVDCERAHDTNESTRPHFRKNFVKRATVAFALSWTKKHHGFDETWIAVFARVAHGGYTH